MSEITSTEDNTEKKKAQQRTPPVLTDKDRTDQYVSVDVYAMLSTEAGVPLTPQAVNARLAAGTMKLIQIQNIQGLFIDKTKYPFKKLPRGPKKR